MQDREVKLYEVAEIVSIVIERVDNILQLGRKKFTSRWMPRLLTPDPKQKRVKDSECGLALFRRFWISASIPIDSLSNGWKRITAFINLFSEYQNVEGPLG